ncbi:AAA family ATPase [Victivallis vadensis]|uniref:AAA family ATPase n=1 Tax=Victivallis vadensis TaxID=172901 RepID=A0A848B0C8_9BACT|nr:AAA family ATPase [Victivallis vadensis]NMD89334.1 AAA family ATPase [Victivallis vadensis]
MTRHPFFHKIWDIIKESQAIELQFVRVPVWYRPLPVLHSIQELISAYKATPPQPYKEDIRILTPEEFETIRGMAEQRIGMPPEAWWKTERERKTSISFFSEEKPSVSDRFDYIFWPLLIRGTSTMFYARKSLGKSALSHSIAACLSAVGKPRLFEENHWGASRGSWNSYKVLYLDFENGETGHKDLLKRVCYPYWRTEKSKQDEDSKNFIWKNMPELGLIGINYALPENHQQILDMLDAASNEGEPGHPVDVLVIDTYHEFTQLQDQVNTHQGLRALLRTLNERNIATLVLNHPKPSNDSQMYGHGIILESFFYVMDLERKGRDSHSLAEPMEVHFKAVRSGWLATNQEPFKIYQPKSPGKWHLYSPERSAAEELESIKNYYMKTEKFSKEEVASLLGTSAASLYRSLNKKDDA